MTAMCLAYLDACGDDLVHSSTFLNCGVDYEARESRPPCSPIRPRSSR